MSFTLVAIFTSCIAIPAFIGVLRFQAIDPVYRPFLFCIWIGCCNEILSYILIMTKHQTVINDNVYNLVESFLFIYQFQQWGLFRRKKALFAWIIAILGIIWVVENLAYKLSEFDSWFLIAYSAIICFLSITMINKLIVAQRGSLLKNPDFVICVTFVIYYAFSVLTETFRMYGLNENRNFRLNVAIITVITNLVANILYSFAIIWMPTKRQFTLPSL